MVKQTSRERIAKYRSRRKTADEQLAERAKQKKKVGKFEKRAGKVNESSTIYRDWPFVSGSALNGKRR